MYLYSLSTNGFYLDAVTLSLPNDAIEITDEEHRALVLGCSQGKVITIGGDGRPGLADPAPYRPAREEVESDRLRAYADPVTGSDRFFAEVQRMQAMGESGWEQIREAGVLRFSEIQSQYPWE